MTSAHAKPRHWLVDSLILATQLAALMLGVAVLGYLVVLIFGLAFT